MKEKIKIKADFKIDLISGEKIDIKKWKEKLSKKLIRQNGNYYFSEISDFYHETTYGKSLVEILSTQIELPVCPITGSYPSYKLQGSICFGVYSSTCTAKQIADYVAANNENYIAFVERMKEERKGEGNPMHGATPWNKGLTKEEHASIMQTSEKMTGRTHDEESLKKMSDSAKKRKVHGHTGHKHSEETKQRLREITIERHRNGLYSWNKS